MNKPILKVAALAAFFAAHPGLRDGLVLRDVENGNFLQRPDGLWLPSLASLIPAPIVTLASAGTWSTLDTITLDLDGTGEEDEAYRVVSSVLPKNITQIRVTAEAPTAAACNVDNVSVGIRSGSTEDTTGVPTEILFSAVSGFSITTNATLLSDATSFIASLGDTLLICVDIDSTNGNVAYSTSASYNMYRATNTNTYNIADATMTLNGGGQRGGVINKIEIFG